MVRIKKNRPMHAVDILLSNTKRFGITDREANLLKKMKDFEMAERYLPNPHNPHLLRNNKPHLWYMTAGPWWDLWGATHQDRMEELELEFFEAPNLIDIPSTKRLREYTANQFFESMKSEWEIMFGNLLNEELIFVLLGGRRPLKDIRINCFFPEPNGFTVSGGANRQFSDIELYAMAYAMTHNGSSAQGYVLGSPKEINKGTQSLPVMYCYRKDIE